MFSEGLRCLLLGCTFVVLAFDVGQSSNTVFEVSYNGEIEFDASGGIITEPRLIGSDQIMPGFPEIPWTVAHFEATPDPKSYRTIQIMTCDTLDLAIHLPPSQPRVLTSDTSHQPAWVPPDPTVYSNDRWLPSNGVGRATIAKIHGKTIGTVEWCPFRYNPARNQLIVIRRALLVQLGDQALSPTITEVDTITSFTGLRDRTISGGDNDLSRPMMTPGLAGGPAWIWPSNPPLGVEYVIVTSKAFVDVVRPLVDWKARRGINAGLATMEAIESSYSGIDGADALRNYLKDAYAAGLEWVVLGGDETVVPMRLAYAGYKSTPPDHYDLQICDLYFAELDGDWDADGDGIYGEYFGDNPEVLNELQVGRLPFSESVEAQVIIAKIIAYESGPVDAGYLTDVLDVCADQMRDWSGGLGQHEEVAETTPSNWEHNSNSMIELPSGDSESPFAPDGPSLPSLLADGYGWVNYFVHGRADGIVVRAVGYEGHPKSYVWTFGDASDGQGHLNGMATTPTPGIHISIGCNHGAFDMDTPPFAPGMHESVAERLLFTPEGNAVAFVGQSRWGWVSTSYRLIEEFYQAVDDEAVPNHIGLYHTLMKQAYPSYRDLVYGNNLYGDPEMPVWKSEPSDLNVVAPVTYSSGESEFTIQINGEGGPPLNAIATLAIRDSIWVLGETGAVGILSADVDLPPAAELLLTVYVPGARTFVDTIPHSIVTDVGDDESLPRSPEIMLNNYPNPFNPSTSIQFSIPQAAIVNLTVFDILGRPVVELIDAHLDDGSYDVAFGFDGSQRHDLASGVYLARLTVDGVAKVRKMVLLQ